MGFLAQNSQNIFQMIANNFRAFVWILIIGAIAVARIVKFLKEQNEARARADARRRAEQESLRTGRGLEVSLPNPGANPSLQADSENKTAGQRLEELAAQRRAQVEELRRRRAAATAGPGGSARATQATSPTAPVRASNPAARQAPASASQPAARSSRAAPKPQEASGPASKPSREKPAPQVVRSTPPARVPAKPSPVEIDPGESVVHRLVQDMPASESRSEARPVRPARSRWRQALMHREILSPPLSLRDDA